MLSAADKETLKDAVHVVISGQVGDAPFNVEWIRRRVVNRAGLEMYISNDDDAAKIIEETMDEILTQKRAFPNVSEVDPGTQGERRWVVASH
ncbi:hypothetical protein ASG19_06550 [Rhizobium sp. Leaf306]|uniref:hypothetical protein n=1 Tax=Rhizobium sp. Leaf306 TaxID=1736330 RepID=UPI0007133E09|nr:hypothetical protein [Rhizobium sp. Leaf306]KQQ38677.1 hypothetical protein ASG19_06550 [Rhizobium sp. Leaf306]